MITFYNNNNNQVRKRAKNIELWNIYPDKGKLREERETERKRERSRCVKIKNIKKQNLLYGCFNNNPHKR